jgi:hypothetical protein
MLASDRLSWLKYSGCRLASASISLLDVVLGLAPLHPNIPTSKASYRLDPRLRQHSERDETQERDIQDRLLAHMQRIQWLSAPPHSIAAPASPKAARKKVPKYSTIHSNNLRVFLCLWESRRSCIPVSGSHGSDWCSAYNVPRMLLIVDLLLWTQGVSSVYDLVQARKNGWSKT